MKVSKRDEFTYRLLKGHIKNGDRVLDVGCGMGEVSALLSHFVGSNGQVLGIDKSESVLELARTKHSQSSNLTFEAYDVLDLPEHLGQFDAIVGRRVLMYLPDPLAVLKQLKKHLKTGGKIIFQESYVISNPLNTAFPVSQKIMDYMRQTVLAEQGDVAIGMKLYDLFKQAGFSVEDVQSEWILQTAETGTDLLLVFPAMQQRMRDYGILEGDSDDLQAQLEKEWQTAQGLFYRDFAFGISASKANENC